MAWFYLEDTAARPKTLGPLEDADFYALIRAGSLPRDTMVGSPEHTGGQWYELQAIPALMEWFNQGEADRKRRADEKARAEKEKQWQQKAEQRKHEAAELARLAKEEQERLDAELAHVKHAAERREREASNRAIEWIETPRRPETEGGTAPRRGQLGYKLGMEARIWADTPAAFERYWMPSFLSAVWLVCIALMVLVIVATVGVAIWRVGGGDLDFIPAMAVSLTVAGLGGFYLVVIRLVLESFAVVFDIRALLRRQLALLENRLPEAAATPRSQSQSWQ